MKASVLLCVYNVMQESLTGWDRRKVETESRR